ncbi:MAG: tail fiber domain-containing protein [Bacteroidales bacterium]|nr:tail fiber domain-containing protein [Bacteroidales bacterium]
MKTLISNLLLLLFTLSLFSQSPQKFSYQAVVRDASGNPINNTTVGVQLSILQGSSSGTAVCVEEFSPATNEFGLIILEVGSANTIDFEAIDWSAGPYYLKVELDAAGGTSYTEMGTSQLLSVPFALHALTVSDIMGELIINNEGELPNSEYLTFQSHGNNMSRIQSQTADNLNSSLMFWNSYDGTMAEKMRLDSLGNLGIGTTTPSAGLDLNKYVANNANDDIYGSKIYLEETGMTASHSITGLKVETNPGGSGWSSESYETGIHVKVRDLNDAAAVFETGNVGIGTLTPSYKLEVNSSTLAETAGSQNNLMRLTGHSGNTDNLLFLHRRYADGTDWHTAEIKLLKYVDATPMHYISFKGGESSASRFLELGYNETAAIIIDGSNRVGIGTTSPRRALDVAGDVKFGNDLTVWEGTKALSFRQDVTNSYISNKADFVSNGSTDNGLLYLNGQGGVALRYGAEGSSGTTKFYLNDQGNIGIGGISPSSQLDVGVKSTYSDEDPIFVVRNNHGNPVFAVYNNGVRVTIEDDPSKKGPKGGFAIGGFDQTKAGETYDFMRITPDSVRFYINNSPESKSPKGGFAIGSFDRTKGELNKNFMHLSPEGADEVSNVQMGFEAGENAFGLHNTYIGYKAGYSQPGGASAGNIFMGQYAGYNNTGGYFFRFTPPPIQVLEMVTYGGNNILIGNYSGRNVYGTTEGQGTENVFLGNYTGYSQTTASGNVYIGNSSGYKNTTGNTNTHIGYKTGYNATTASGNVFLGFQAGYFETTSNKLYINNSSSSYPLIWGDFYYDRVVIDGNSGNNPNGRTFYVNGTAGGDYAWFNDSDMRLKKDIVTIDKALDKVMNLRGVYYEWKEPGEGAEGRQMGFIGQEASDIIPEVVTYSNDHYSMQYAPISAILVEAVKEQQTIIKEQQKQIDELKILVDQLISR